MERGDAPKEEPKPIRGRARGRAQSSRGFLRFRQMHEESGAPVGAPTSPLTPTSSILPHLQGWNLATTPTEAPSGFQPFSESPPVAGTSSEPPVPEAPATTATEESRPTPKGEQEAEARSATLHTRPAGLESKKGTSGKALNIITNYYKITSQDALVLHHYHVSFSPDTPVKNIRTGAVRAWSKQLEQAIGCTFDHGSALYSTAKIPQDPSVYVHTDPKGINEPIEVKVKHVGEIPPSSHKYIMFYNRLVSSICKKLQLTNIRGNYFDQTMTIRIPAYGLELLPGFTQTIQQHETSPLLCVDTCFKILRSDSVLDLMNQIRRELLDRNPNTSKTDILEAWKAELVGTIIMATYNSKTYRVDDIDISQRPTDSFTIQTTGEKVTYKQHFLKKFKVEISFDDQPMLISFPTKWEIRRGKTGNKSMVPELCQTTGLTDKMRNNFQLMKSVNEHVQAPPTTRVNTISSFMGRIQNNADIQTFLNEWKMGFDKNLVKVPGRTLPPESLTFGNSQTFQADAKGDFTPAFRSKTMLSSVNLKDWVIIIPRRDAGSIDGLINTLKKVGQPLNFQISDPKERKIIDGRRAGEFSRAIEELMNKHRGKLGLIFVILPNKNLDNYSAVKKACYSDYGMQSQCFVAKNLTNQKGLMSICTKVAVQINAKLGGEPWGIVNPLKDATFIGFDVYHSAARNSPSIGAMVATVNRACSRYFSTTSVHATSQEMSENISEGVLKCLLAYKEVNGVVPSRIFFYRDGVGEGQLEHVLNQEVSTLKATLKKLYDQEGKEEVKLTFVVVTKRISTRLFLETGSKRYDNPSPGTIVDDVITKPERYDFFLISQVTRQGTVSPTHYNVLYDNKGLSPDKLQMLTYKLCSGYFNWSGTVSVPAPCQYAHKLAYMMGLCIKHPVHADLPRYLYYL